MISLGNIDFDHFHIKSNYYYDIYIENVLYFSLYSSGISLTPRLIWWPFRSFFLNTTIESYFRASSIELYFIQCICENFLRCFSVYLQIFARMTTLEIVSEMHEHINLKHYPLLSLLRHHHMKQPWQFLLSLNLIDAKLIRRGLSIFLRQAN